jgi:Skp family chaperone for outer membrane proteins
MQKARKYGVVPILRSWGLKAVVATGTAMLLGVLPSASWAAGPGSGKIGFIDMKRLERESLFGQGVAQHAKEEKVKGEQELKGLDEEAETLRQAMSKLSPEERKQKTAELQTKAEGIEQRKAERPKKAQAKQEQVARDFKRKVHAAVQAYAKEEGLIAVFLKGRGGLFYGDEGIDITGPVLERLNKQGAARDADSAESPPKR